MLVGSGDFNCALDLEQTLSHSDQPLIESVEFSPSEVIAHYHHFALHHAQITAGWPEVMWIQSLPKASTHDQHHWKQNSTQLNLWACVIQCCPTWTPHSTILFVSADC